MEPEMNTENWNGGYQSQNQTNPCEQPQESPCSQGHQWLQQRWFNIKLMTWLKCLIIVIVLSVAAVFIVPKFTSADGQQNFSASDPEVEYGWYGDYDYDYDYDYGN